MNLILLNPAFVYSNRVQWFGMDAYAASDPNMLSSVYYNFDIWQEKAGPEDARTRLERIRRILEYLIASLHDILTDSVVHLVGWLSTLSNPMPSQLLRRGKFTRMHQHSRMKIWRLNKGQQEKIKDTPFTIEQPLKV